MNIKNIKFFLIGLLILGVDQITKFLAYEKIIPMPVVINRGIAWSIFHYNEDIYFLLISLVVLCCIGMLIFYGIKHCHTNGQKYGITLLLSGAISNFCDRLIYGGVVDFICIAYKSFVWPTIFNIADVAIIGGILLLIIIDFL